MGQRNCPECFGCGYTRRTEHVMNLSGGGMWREVVVQKTCFLCHGRGKLDDSSSFSAPIPCPSSRTTQAGTANPAAFEEFAANILSIGIWAMIAYYGITRTELEWYWPTGIGAVLGLLVYWLFTGPLRKVLTIVKYILIVALVFGTIAVLLNTFQ